MYQYFSPDFKNIVKFIDFKIHYKMNFKNSFILHEKRKNVNHAINQWAWFSLLREHLAISRDAKHFLLSQRGEEVSLASKNVLNIL